jgi:hypothetical protein
MQPNTGAIQQVFALRSKLTLSAAMHCRRDYHHGFHAEGGFNLSKNAGMLARQSEEPDPVTPGRLPSKEVFRKEIAWSKPHLLSRTE